MLGFGNSLFLLALVGLAVPVILHLINRELAVNLRFPSIRFIDQSQLPRREKRKLRDLLLLLLRLFLFASIVLAFAKPVWIEPLVQASERSSLRQTVYLLDASSSMSRGNIWRDSLDALRKDLADTESDEIGLVVFADRVLSQVPPSVDEEQVENLLKGLEPTFAAGDPATGLQSAVRFFNPDAEKRLVLISDFQETDWQRDLPGIPEDVKSVFMPAEIGGGQNVGIVNVNTIPIGKEQARIFVAVRNNGTESVTVPVIIEGGTISEEKMVTLSPGQTGNATFVQAVTEPIPLTANLPSDRYIRDNRWHFWLAPPPLIRVYAFLPNLDEPRAVNAFYYFQTALEVESDTDWVRFEVTALDRGFFEESVIQDADVVVIPAASAYLRDHQWEVLKNYIAEGQTAILLPGDGFPKQFRALERNGMMSSRFLGLAGNTNERQTPYHLGSVHPSSHLAQTFDDVAAKDLFLVNVYRYVRLQASQEDLVILAFENGDPALLRLAVGQGGLIASTFAFDPSWTDMPLRNSFLPLVRELVQEGFDTNRLRKKMFMEEVVLVADPLTQPAALHREGQYWEVNVNPSESVMIQIDTEQYLPALLSQKPLYTQTTGSVRIDPRLEGSRTDLWPWLLMIALLCFFLESLLTGIKDAAQSSVLKRRDPVQRA